MGIDIFSYAFAKQQGGTKVTELNATQNGKYTAEAGNAYNPVTVNVAQNVTTSSLNVTSNGAYSAESGKAYSSVNVNVQPNLQSKSVTVTASGSQTVTPDNGYQGLSGVQISADITPSLQNKTVSENGTVTADAGYDGLGEVTVSVGGQIKTLAAVPGAKDTDIIVVSGVFYLWKENA